MLAGKAALLVDSGMGDGGLTGTFAPEAQAGLAEIVSGAAGLVRVALQDEGTGLFFLPRIGPTGGVTATQIAREFFGAARRFGPIVVDGAALGSDGLTQRFAEAVDDIVLVLREGEIGRGDLESATAMLGPHAAKIRGFIVNEA
jgi:Mrp family chromosome partitioning ATPase